MITESYPNGCEHAEQVCACAARTLPKSDVLAVEAHIASCPRCRRELETLRPVIDSLLTWPQAVLRPAASLQERLARRISADAGGVTELNATRRWSEPEWEEVAPGISCKLLALDSETHMVSMLVRLAPGAEYPPHSHAAFEELHLLDGELWIDERKLYPGEYNRAERGTRDERVWSETGCTCFLVTSTEDALR